MDNIELAELLMGIAKAQNALIDAVERANPGFRNTHCVPMLTTAANVRSGTPRVQDLPSRILLRMQGRAAFDIAAILEDLERSLAADEAARAAPAPASDVEARAAAAAASAPAPTLLTRAAPSAAAARPAAAPTARPAAAPPDDLDFSAKP